MNLKKVFGDEGSLANFLSHGFKESADFDKELLTWEKTTNFTN